MKLQVALKLLPRTPGGRLGGASVKKGLGGHLALCLQSVRSGSKGIKDTEKLSSLSLTFVFFFKKKHSRGSDTRQEA